ncbi:hypothetical protein [Streptomyces sp. NBC_01216]|uniref:hypothetical protein n=1 Tax=unclassified Streptomyces TaxID=2593676 RepID=UPI002E150C8B|nr:hypothetical protein OG393_18460 [Streptomyces sp. NBC_01216]
MFRQLTADERRALTDKLAARGVAPQQFTQAQELARAMSKALAHAYGEAIGRRVTPVEFVAEALGVEGAGRLLVCALREITGRPDLYRDA